jgi:hypothetical protein
MFQISAQAKIVGDGTTAIDASGGVSKLIGVTNDANAYALQVENVSNNSLLYVRNDGYTRVGNVSGNLLSFTPEFEIGKSKNGAVISAITNTSTGVNNYKILIFYQDDTSYTSLSHLGPNASAVNWGYPIPNHFVINNVVGSANYDSGIILGGSPIILYSGDDVKDGSAKLKGDGLYISSSADIYSNTSTKATARLHIQTANKTASSFALKIIDSTSDTIMFVRNDANVGIGTSSNDASAKLQIDSTTQGVLLPRMTTAQRDAIATPASGLEIYNTSTTSPNYYDGTTWQQVTNKSYVDTNIVSAQVPARLFNYYNFI